MKNLIWSLFAMLLLAGTSCQVPADIEAEKQLNNVLKKEATASTNLDNQDFQGQDLNTILTILINQLKDELFKLQESGIFNRGQYNSLDQKVDLALSHILLGNYKAATNMLLAFTKEIDALSDAGILTEEEWLNLDDRAYFIIDILNGELCWRVEKLNTKCKEANSLSEKQKLLNESIQLQVLVDLLGIEECVYVMDYLCGGILNAYIEADPNPLLMIKGETKKITAEIFKNSCNGGEFNGDWCEDDNSCQNGTCEEEKLTGELTWRSLQENIVTVDDNGNVTAVSEGITQIEVASKDFPKDIFTLVDVEVEYEIDKVVLSPIETSIWVDGQYIIKAILFDKAGNVLPTVGVGFSWSANNGNIIKPEIEGDGSQNKVTGIMPGVATLKVSVGDKTAECIVNVYTQCPEFPELEDCPQSEYIYSEQFEGSVYGSGSIAGASIKMDSEDEAIISFGIEFGSCEACIDIDDPPYNVCTCVPPGEHCQFYNNYCKYLSGYVTWNVTDQNGALISASGSGGPGGGGDSRTLIVQGNNGDCGHPVSFSAFSKAGANYMVGGIEVRKRPGWNSAGWNMETARDIALLNTWCGNINECDGGTFGGVCSNDPTWSVYLEPEDTLNIRLSLTCNYVGGTLVDLDIRDESWIVVRNLTHFYFLKGTAEEMYRYTNKTGKSQKFYIVLNNHFGSLTSRGYHINKYSAAFNVAKYHCINALPSPICPPEDPGCY
jgi:hypothetical protein